MNQCLMCCFHRHDTGGCWQMVREFGEFGIGVEPGQVINRLDCDLFVPVAGARAASQHMKERSAL